MAGLKLIIDKNKDFVTICGFLSKSKRYRKSPISDLGIFIYPLVDLGYYKIFPTGFITWTWFSDEVEKKFIKHSRSIRAEDHNSGDNFWIMDLVCLGGAKELRKLRDHNTKHFGHLTIKYARGFRKNRPIVEKKPRCLQADL